MHTKLNQYFLVRTYLNFLDLQFLDRKNLFFKNKHVI